MTNHDYDAVSDLEDNNFDDNTFDILNNPNDPGTFVKDIPGATYEDLADVDAEVPGAGNAPPVARDNTYRKGYLHAWTRRVQADTGITQHQLAKLMGCSYGYLSTQWLAGSHAAPSTENVTKYAIRISKLPVYARNHKAYVFQVAQGYAKAMVLDKMGV